MRIEEKYENVMLNIEMQVVSVANKEPTLTDWQVEKVYNALLSRYKALMNGRQAKEVSFNSPANDLYLLIEGFCDFFVGDRESWGKGDYLIEIETEKVSYQNMVAIFKRLRKSVKTWTKRGGSKGYVYYISQFISLPSSGKDGENPVIDAFIEEGLARTEPTKSRIGKIISSFSKK